MLTLTKGTQLCTIYNTFMKNKNQYLSSMDLLQGTGQIIIRFGQHIHKLRKEGMLIETYIYRYKFKPIAFYCLVSNKEKTRKNLVFLQNTLDKKYARVCKDRIHK